MKYFKNLFFNKAAKKILKNNNLHLHNKDNSSIDHSSLDTHIITNINNTNIGEPIAREISNNFSNLINKLENKSYIKKIENNFNDFSTNKSMLRTIVDESPLQEDIFKNIIRISKSEIPAKPENKKDKISLFLPFDDILAYAYIPDENFGMSDLPKHRDYNFRLELPEYKTFAFVFLRDNIEEFLNFINENFEPILYTTGERNYIDKIMQVIDPSNIFKIKLYQQDCHLYKDSSQNHLEYLKDINLFTNRPLNKKLLLDTSAFNYLLSPDNGKYVEFHNT